MSQDHPAVAERRRLRRRNAAIAMGFGLLLCVGAAYWAAGTLGLVGERVSAEQGVDAAAPSTPDPAAPSVQGGSATAPAATTSAAVAVTSFVSPSGNIACVISEQFARCDLADKQWEVGTPPADCTGTFGAGVVVDASGPRVTCASDSLIGSGGQTLGYGRERTVGDFSCVSSEAGMRCVQASTGLGFSVSRRAYTFF